MTLIIHEREFIFIFSIELIVRNRIWKVRNFHRWKPTSDRSGT